MRKENDDLKKVLSQRDVKIRVLEIELEKLKTQREENKSEGSTEGNASGNDEKPAVNDQLEEQQPDKSKEDVDASPATE